MRLSIWPGPAPTDPRGAGDGTPRGRHRMGRGVLRRPLHDEHARTGPRPGSRRSSARPCSPRWPATTERSGSGRSCWATPTDIPPWWRSGRPRSTASATGGSCSASERVGRRTSTTSTASTSPSPVSWSTGSRRPARCSSDCCASRGPRSTGRHYVTARRRVRAEAGRSDPLPLLIGGKGNRMLGIVARHADEWNMWATPAMLQGAGRGARRPVRRDRTGPADDPASDPGARPT